MALAMEKVSKLLMDPRPVLLDALLGEGVSWRPLVRILT